MVREPPSSEKEKAENDWRRGASAFRLRPMSDLPQPEVIITHESDLDGFVSGHLLQRLAGKLFDADVPLQAWNYDNWERRRLREKSAWVCDLNFTKRMDREEWLIVDHHATDVTPEKCRLIHDTTKSASLLCYELCREHGLGSDTLDRLVHLTNVGDLFLTEDSDFQTSLDYGGLVKQYLFWNLQKLTGGNLESLMDHPLLEVVTTRRRVENPLGLAYAKLRMVRLSEEVGLVEVPVGDTNAVVHQLLDDAATPYPVLMSLVVRARVVSVSLRSRNGEALKWAKRLQGGGHPNACGATLPRNIQRAPDAVEYLKKVLAPRTPAEAGLGDLASALGELDLKQKPAKP